MRLSAKTASTKKAAKKLSPNEVRARRRLACHVARLIQCSIDSADRVFTADSGSGSAEWFRSSAEARGAMETFWSMACWYVTSRRDPANFLEMVVEALKGKSRCESAKGFAARSFTLPAWSFTLPGDRGGDYDEMIIAAYDKARGMDICPRCFEHFQKAFASEWKERFPNHPVPTNFSLRRSLERLNLFVPHDKHGGRRQKSDVSK